MLTINRIIDLLKVQSKSQNDLAEYLSIGKQVITDWKSGKSESYKKRLPEISEYLNTTIEYLLGKTDDPTADETNIGYITPREKAVLLAYREKKDMQTAVERLLDVKIEDHPKEAVPTAKEPQEPEYDSFMKRVDTLTDHGRIKLKDAKIAAYGGYENPVATGEDLEKLKQIRRLLQEVIDEQHNQSGE